MIFHAGTSENVFHHELYSNLYFLLSKPTHLTVSYRTFCIRYVNIYSINSFFSILAFLCKKLQPFTVYHMLVTQCWRFTAFVETFSPHIVDNLIHIHQMSCGTTTSIWFHHPLFISSYEPLCLCVCLQFSDLDKNVSRIKYSYFRCVRWTNLRF